MYDLRLMTEADLERVRQWRNHPDVRRHMYSQHEISAEEHRSWFEQASHDVTRQLLLFQIGDVPTGFVSFRQATASRVSDWGFYIAPDAPRGTGHKLGETALRHGFVELELHKLCGQVLATNARSIRFHQSLGFQREGVLRDQHFNGKSYLDVICFGLLADEWPGKR